MRRFPLPLLILLPALLLAGCDLFGPEPVPLPPPKPAVVKDDPPKPLVAGVADLPLLAEPEATADRLGSLAQNEELLRFKTFQGFAYVEVRDTGAKGWVDNSLLMEQAAGPKPLPSGEDIPPEDGPSGSLPGPGPGPATDQEGPISETF